jgi:hypothetical protein
MTMMLMLLVLMASLKSDNIGKVSTLEQIAADLMSSSVNGVQSMPSAMVNDLLTTDRKYDAEELSVNDLQHFTELRPLFDATADGTLTSSAGKLRNQTHSYSVNIVLRSSSSGRQDV